MIALIKGKIVEKGTNYVVLMAGSVGFLVHIPLSTYVNLTETDEEVTFYTHTIFRENGVELYG
ncbi:MAG: OB-fold domain-containing protein, partial [Desulfatiglandales bacterium]